MSITALLCVVACDGTWGQQSGPCVDTQEFGAVPQDIVDVVQDTSLVHESSLIPIWTVDVIPTDDDGFETVTSCDGSRRQTVSSSLEFHTTDDEVAQGRLLVQQGLLDNGDVELEHFRVGVTTWSPLDPWRSRIEEHIRDNDGSGTELGALMEAVVTFDVEEQMFRVGVGFENPGGGDWIQLSDRDVAGLSFPGMLE